MMVWRNCGPIIKESRKRGTTKRTNANFEYLACQIEKALDEEDLKKTHWSEEHAFKHKDTRAK